MPALDLLGSLPSLTGRRSRTARSLLAGLVLGVGLFTAAPIAHARSYEDVLIKDSTYYWRLGVPSGGRDQRDGVDSSLAYGHQVKSGEPGALAAGDDGSVRLFGAVPDGVWESHLTLDTSPGAARDRRPFGFEIWVKPASLDANTRRIVSAENAGGGYLVGARSDRLVFSRYARTRAGTTWDTIAVAPPAIGRWTQIVASYDGAVMRLYLNGRQAGSRQSTVSLPADWTTPYMPLPPDYLDFGHDFIRLGAHTGKWLEWDGWLDEAAYYNNLSEGAVLTPAMIEDHYRVATTGT
jgi:concanavalin A-like lectin/glucanase superfamily protein